MKTINQADIINLNTLDLGSDKLVICIFDNDRSNKFHCTYECTDSKIIVKVFKELYDDETESLGVHRKGQKKEEYKPKNLVLIDSENKKYFKLFNCNISNYSTRFGSVDEYESVSYSSRYYIQSNDYNNLLGLPENPRVNSIKIYHDTISWIHGFPSFTNKENEERILLEFKKGASQKEIDINKYNIDKISLSDDWNIASFRENGFRKEIELNCYIQIFLKRTIAVLDITEYIKEFEIYMELLRSNRGTSEKVHVEIDSIFYQFVGDVANETNTKKRITILSVQDTLENFLLNCYTNLPIRKSNNSNRNISYVLFNKHRNIEDSFLLYYRFIECYYKKKNFQSTFISKALEDSKNIYLKYFIEDEFEKIVSEIINLRNHYVHSGYYIRGRQLSIKFENKSKNYNAKVDINWIYDRTKMLYYIVIDIIYKQMLSYKSYNYSKNFYEA